MASGRRCFERGGEGAGAKRPETPGLGWNGKAAMLNVIVKGTNGMVPKMKWGCIVGEDPLNDSLVIMLAMAGAFQTEHRHEGVKWIRPLSMTSGMLEGSATSRGEELYGGIYWTGYKQ